MSMVNQDNFSEIFTRNMIAPVSGHTNDNSKLKDILANKIFRSDGLEHLAVLAGLEQVDVKNEKSIKEYIERAAAVVRELCFDEDQNIKPWLANSLRYYGYKGDFDDPELKKLLINGALFQVVQTSVDKRYRHDYDDKPRELFRMLLLNVRRLQSEWTGCADRQTETVENKNRTAKDMLDHIDRNEKFDDLRDEVPEIDMRHVEEKLIENSKLQFEKAFISNMQRMEKSFRPRPIEEIANNIFFSNRGCYYLSRLAEADDVDIADPKDVEAYVARCTVVLQKMLFDDKNQLKPWAKKLCELHNYRGDYNDEDMKKFLHAGVMQMVETGLKEHYQHVYDSETTQEIYTQSMEQARNAVDELFRLDDNEWDMNMLAFHVDETEFSYPVDDAIPNPVDEQLTKMITPVPFDQVLQNNMELDISSQEDGLSQIKDIVTNHLFQGDVNSRFADMARCYDVDIRDDESVTQYLERCAAVVSEFMFTPENEVKPWVKDLLRSSGYSGDFDDAAKKHMLSAALFQLVQGKLVANIASEFTSEDPKKNSELRQELQELRMNIRKIQSVWTGMEDRQTKTAEDPNITAESLLNAMRHESFSDLRQKVPKITKQQARQMIVRKSRDDFESNFSRYLASSENLPERPVNPRASDIISNKLLSNHAVYHLANMANLGDLQMSDFDDDQHNALKAYANRALAVTAGMLFDQDNQVKPWVKDLLISQGYSGDMDSDKFKKQLLNSTADQLVIKSLTQHFMNLPNANENQMILEKAMFDTRRYLHEQTASGNRTLGTEESKDWCINHVLFSLNTDMDSKKLMEMAPDPSSKALVDELARESLKTIMRRIELDTKSKWSFKHKSKSTITVDGKKYPVPKRIAKAYKLIQEGLENDIDPKKISSQVEEIISSKIKDGLDKSPAKTKQAYQHIHSLLKTEREHRAVVVKNHSDKLALRKSA